MKSDNIGVYSDRITESKPLTIDEAAELKGVSGKSAEKFKEEIAEMQSKNNQFSEIYSVVFGWKKQPDGSKKLVSKHPSGRIMFPDKSIDEKDIEAGNAYLCLVYVPEFNAKGEPAREAFAKIICEEYQPKIYELKSGVVTYAYRDKKDNMKRGAEAFGKTTEERIVEVIRKYRDELKFPSCKIIFRKNDER